MTFDVKKHFPRKEGFGDTALSIPYMQAEISRLQAEVERLLMCEAAAFSAGYEAAEHTAWNDAIEAALEKLHWLYAGDKASIRTLKREAGNAP